ncbi:MAG: DUF5683 domain-containing protein [Bacteroidota bacterium]
MRAVLLGLLVGLALPEADAQVDTTATAPAVAPAGVTVDSTRLRSPRAAVTRAMILPGWGQVYNREWAKAPIATALAAGAIVYAVNRQRRYRLFQRSAFYAFCIEEPDREVCTEADVADAMDEWIETGQPTGASARTARESLRGQRDIAFLVVGLAYAVQALDAYVAAELSGFDVSEDLSMHLVPTPQGAALGLRIDL